MTESPKKLIKVTIEPRKNSRALCSCCGKLGPTYDTPKDPRAFDYIPLWNLPVRFYYCMRRVDCRHCKRVITEAVPWASGKHRLTNDFRIFLAQWARLLSWKDCARMFHQANRPPKDPAQRPIELPPQNRACVSDQRKLRRLLELPQRAP
jgi:hypothetical protein